MAIVHNSVTVGTSATIIATIPAGNPLTAVQISNSDTNPIFLGDSSVAVSGAAKGVRMATVTNLQVWLNAGDVLYAVSSAGTSANAVGVVFSKIIN
jgi:hypothetical protein